MKDEATVERWRREAKKDRWSMTPTMVRAHCLEQLPRPYFDIQINYVLEELHGYASLREPETGIEVWFALLISCTELTCIGF